MVYAQPRTHPRKWDSQTSLGFWDQNGWSNLSLTTRSSDSPKKKKKKKKPKTCPMVEFAILTDHRVKLKESEKRDKCLNLARELKIYGAWKWQ